MQDDLQEESVRRDNATFSRLEERLAVNRSASLTDRFLEKARRLSLSVCDAYLNIQGIRDVRLPSITIVIPVTEKTEKLTRTIESLLSAQYTRLCISLVGLEGTTKIFERLPRHRSIKFFEAPAGATMTEGIRPMLLWADSPIIAWLEPGQTFTPNVLHRVGDIFRQSRVGGVLVPEEKTFVAQQAASTSNLDFGFLFAQDPSFPATIFVRRKVFWGAAKTFAGTDYDCNDWSVALNTARFFEVRLLAGGFYRSGGSPKNPPVKERQKIRARITADMWWTERVRQSARRRCVRMFNRFASLSLQNKETSARPQQQGNWLQMRVPPILTESLAGFSTGERMEFLGAYRWSFATPITRKVFFDCANELLIFQQLSQENQIQDGLEIVERKVSSEKERCAQAFARGATNLLRGLLKPLGEQVGDHIRVSVFPTAKQNQTIDSLTPRPEREGFEIRKPNELFDLLIVDQPLNSSLRPHRLLRHAANHLTWGGWLIAGCTIFEIETLNADWCESTAMMQSGHEVVFTRKSLGDLLQVAGFTATHVLGLTQPEPEIYALESSATNARLCALAQRLFQTAVKNTAGENYLLLACQRTF
jgi:hypothetical protein